MNCKRLLICAGVLSVFTVVMNSCSKNINDIYIATENPSNNTGNNGNNGTGSGTGGGSENQSLIQFSAGIESQNTKSVYAFPKNRYANILAFANGAAPVGNPLAGLNYIANSPGTLTSMTGSPMYLPNGSYDFYSVATNLTKNSNPNFSNGVSDPLSNGIDYLYWNTKAVAISSSQISIPITYSHECTQVGIKLKNGNGIVIDSLTAATITPSATGATMSLSTGLITPATSLSSTAVNMGVNSLTAQYTMLPVNTTSQAKATFTIYINSEKSPRNYQVSFALPTGGWTAGNSYVYQATVNANEIVFSPVNVRDWIPVDETNTPLYPTQI